MHETGDLERKYLQGLIQQERAFGTEKLETAKLVDHPRGTARNPPFVFPNTVNNNVVRLTGLQVFALAAISAGGHDYVWGRYVAVALLIDFFLRLVSGSFISPLGMTATVLASPFKPNFRPGPPKQFAAFCGVFFSLMGTIFFFIDFEYHEFVAAGWMGALACAAGLEGFFDFCLGCVFYGFGIQFGLIPDDVYRIHTSSKQEISDSWDYMYTNSKAPKPTIVDTDPSSEIALKYKRKTDEWTKDDWHLVRNMQVSYFAMPLALAGLSLTFKVASDWGNILAVEEERSIIVHDLWFVILACIAAFFYAAFLVLYGMRLFLYPHKCWIEWDCPLRSNSFGMISIALMLFGFLCYDEIDLWAGRLMFWIGAVLHVLLTVAKTGEWMSRRMELEHVHPHYMIVPVGLAVAAMVAPFVQPFPQDSGNAGGNIELARFFLSFAWLMWITLFVVSFFKVVTEHNSDDRLRHGVWIWMAAPCLLGIADYVLCTADGFLSSDQCTANFSQFYFIGIFFAMAFAWAALPQNAFLGRDKFNMAYWIPCFALDTLAACACLYFILNGSDFRLSRTLQFLFLAVASLANFAAFCHFVTCMIRRRVVFTPEVKWGPLSFMKLTHEAFRGSLITLRHAIDAMDLDNEDTKIMEENIGLFAANFNYFCIVHEEHAKHEDEVIFKTFNDYFADHAAKYNDDHAQDHELLKKWRAAANKLLNKNLLKAERQAALNMLRDELPPFFDDFLEHLRGEEDNLQPIGRKYLPLAVMKQISRQVWEITPASQWEIILPWIIHNLPRHPQRVRYLKVLCWSMPERSQQFGAILYRHVDAVMWERLRTELPEMIPRHAPGFRRYY